MAAPASKVEVRLSAEQRAALERVVHTGTQSAHARRRACILLRADADGPDRWPDERIAEALDINRMTVSRTRTRFAAEGLDATLHKKKAKDRQYRKLDGAQEARLVALTCSDPPQGHARWTMQLLADKLVELSVAESIDPTTVWRTLKKTNSSRG
jgi:transposase